MNLGDMIEKVAADKNITKTQAKAEISYFFGLNGMIAASLKADKVVKLGELGSLKLVDRAARKGRNPQTKEEILIPAKTTAAFKPSKEYQETL